MASAVTSRTPLASTQALSSTQPLADWSATTSVDGPQSQSPSAGAVGVGVAAGGQLPPMLRRLVTRARLSARPASASGLLTSTQELKLATTQQQLIDQQRRAQELAHAQQQRQRRLNQQLQAQQRSHKQNGADEDERPDSAASSRPVSARFKRDLGPLYSRFQAAAQAAQAALAAPQFPGSISTSFERTSYWKRAPPARSDQLGTMGLLFLHYAMPSPAAAVAAAAAGPEQLDDEGLPRLSFRALLFLCTDWKVVPQLTSKARLAEAYHRFGGVQAAKSVAAAAAGARLDVGLSYAAFVRCMACVALEARIPPSSLSSSGGGGAPSLPAALSSANQTARDRVLAFMRHVQWSNLEAVAAGLDALEKSAWFRLRQELPTAKSTFVHKPTCLFKERRRVTTAEGKSVSCVCVSTRPCAHASAPQWAPLAAQVVAGVHDRSAVLHLDPHGHRAHSLALPRPAGSHNHSPKSDAKPRSGSSSLSSLHPLQEKSAPAPQSLGPRRAAASVRSPATSVAAATEHGSSGAELSRDESRAYKCMRVFDRLPLESSWCAYPGAYIDMGVIEVLPALAAGATDAAAATAYASANAQPRRDPSELASAALRPHRYTITLQNRASAALKVSVSSAGCEWLGLQYDPDGFLALGMKQRLHILAPTRMPHDARPSAATTADASEGGAAAVAASHRAAAAGMGAGVERMGCITLSVQNVWTYQCARVSVPVYARLVLQGSSDQLATLPTFRPSPSAPELLAASADEQNRRVPRLQPPPASQTHYTQQQQQQQQQGDFGMNVGFGDAHDGGHNQAWSVSDEEGEEA